MRVIVIDGEPDRAAALTEALRVQGYTVVGRFAPGDDLRRHVVDLNADIIVVDVDSPDRDVLESMRDVSLEQGRPVVMFAQDGNAETIRAAIASGVAAYVVDGLRPERVKPVLDVAVARFAQFRALRSELDKARASLAERKLIERAKGIVMRRRGCDEESAYRMMRRMAMDQKARLADIANRIIDADELLG
ncbi:MAG: ANTAR domain-containing protein [Telmatospirillum sp.]|nr:ANTAR domain-containing protein [Telmatospirillum sp.]